MKISIVVPSYNQAPFLAECLGSVVGQLHPEDELFVVDGGSNDSSPEIIRRYENHITRWVSERDNGQAAAVNKGLKWATGDAIVWLNSDDALMDGALDKLRSHWTQSSEVMIFDAIWINETGQCATIFPAPKLITFMDFRDGTMPINQPSCVISRVQYLKSGGLNENYYYALDYDIIVRIIKNAHIDICHFPFAINRIHGATKTSNFDQLTRELEKVAILHFNGNARAYSTGLFTKYGLRIFPLFGFGFLVRAVLKRILYGPELPGAWKYRLSKTVESWLSAARDCGKNSSVANQSFFV